MCGQPVDSLPLDRSIFSGSWWGIGLGVLIIVGIVVGLTRYQGNGVQAVQDVPMPVTRLPTVTSTPSATLTPTITDTPMPTATPTATATPTPRTHVIERGENPSIIADKYGVSVDDLIALNKIQNVSGLQVGQVLIIPPLSRASGAAETNGLPAPQIVYEVKGGDTLLGIALDHGTTVEAIVAANPDTDIDLIYPGQQLIVPLATPTITPTPPPAATATATPGPLYDAPSLLSPADGQVIDQPVLLFNWTSTALLAQDEFYVLHLTWANGTQTEQWVKNSSWRIAVTQRPANGLIAWTVTIMRQTGTNPDGSFKGINLTHPAYQYTVEWR
jgi:LysM repeat protein